MSVYEYEFKPYVESNVTLLSSRLCISNGLVVVISKKPEQSDALLRRCIFH